MGELLDDCAEFWQLLRIRAPAKTKRADTTSNLTACFIWVVDLLRPIRTGVVNVFVQADPLDAAMWIFCLGLGQKVEALSLVTASAGRHLDQIVAVEGTRAVVAHDAAVRSCFRRMFLSLDIRDLTALLPLAYVMT